MGIKTFKKHFKIEHTVHVKDGELIIGSTYIPEICSWSLDTGEVVKEDAGFLRRNYPELLTVSPQTILNLMSLKDKLDNKIIIYAYENYEVLKKVIEHEGDRVSVDGTLLWTNRIFKTKKEAEEFRKKDIKREIGFIEEQILREQYQIGVYKKRVAKLKERLK